MQAPSLHVLDLEARALHGDERMPDIVELPAREDVLGNRPLLGTHFAPEPTGLGRAPRDRVVEEQSVLRKQPLHLPHVARDVLQPDVLVHADGGDLVKLPLHRGVVLELDRHAVFEPQALDLLARIVELRFRQRDAVRGDVIRSRRMTDEPTPAAADVEEALARLQAQLAANHLQLVALRLRDIVLPIGVVGAGVDHFRVEEERVELVRQVVVELNVVLVVGGLACAPRDLAGEALVVLRIVAARQ